MWLPTWYLLVWHPDSIDQAMDMRYIDWSRDGLVINLGQENVGNRKFSTEFYIPQTLCRSYNYTLWDCETIHRARSHHEITDVIHYI